MNLHQLSAIEYDAMFHSDSCNALSIQDEPFDLASEIEPSIYDKYMPNDGTSRVEHRLRKQGLRKADDAKREQAQDIIVTTQAPNRRTTKLHVLRQNGGEMFISQSVLGSYDQMRNAALERDIAKDMERYKDV